MMNRFDHLVIFFLGIHSLTFISCDGDEAENGLLEASGPIEFPALRNGTDDMSLSPTATLSGEKVTTYSIEYDKSKKHTRWAAFKYYGITGQTNWNRNDWRKTKWGGDPWQSDPDVPQADRRVQSDFGKRGCDRGHICASSGCLYLRDTNEQTFHYSNMSPQKSHFNTGV